jgi:hypothetical protein
MRRKAFIVTGLATALVGCSHGASRPYTVLGADAAELRTAFNADRGKVRVLMLVSPT